MFKNPLKFQQGGVTSSQENEMARIFSAAATKLQMKPEALLQKAQELQGDQQTAFVRAIKDIADSDNPKQESIQMIQSVFGKEPQSFKAGGKIHSFICRFGHGGITDCGCGGSIQKGQAGLVVDTNGSVIPAFADSSVVRSGNWSLQPLFIEDGVLKTYAYGPNGQVLQIVNDGQNVRYLGGRVSDVDGSRRFVQSGDFIGVEDASQVDSPEKYILPSNLVNTYRRMVKNDNTGFLKMRKPVRTVELVPKNQDGGFVLKGQDGLSRAAGYYARHANEGIIRKIQNFLYGRGYYKGDLDGKFGRQTYDAIRKYQREFGAKDDGIWGEDTNAIHSLLNAGDAPYRGPRSGAHPGKSTKTDRFVNQAYQPAGTKVTYTDINNAITRAIQDPEWFMGDTEDAKGWRILFMKRNPDGSRIFDTIYDSNPEFFGQSKFAKKLPTDLAKEAYNNEIRTAQAEALPWVLGAVSLPAVANPLTLAGSAAGGLLGGVIGNTVGSDMKRAVVDENGNVIGYQGTDSRVVGSHSGMGIPVVTPDQSDNGKIIGTVIGAGLGSRFMNGIKSLFNVEVPTTPGDNLATQQARPGATVVRPTAMPTNPSAYPAGAASTSYVTGVNVQNPVTANWAVEGLTVPRTFPAGFKQGGQIEKHQQKNGIVKGQNSIPDEIPAPSTGKSIGAKIFNLIH